LVGLVDQQNLLPPIDSAEVLVFTSFSGFMVELTPLVIKSKVSVIVAPTINAVLILLS
jgi:hypothetical protein